METLEIDLKSCHEIKRLDLNKKIFKASRLTKCEWITIHDTPIKEICDIPIKSEIKYLSIHLSKDQKLSQSLGVESKIKERKRMASERDISVLGGVYSTKMECSSTCIDPAYSNAIPNKLIKSVNQINFNFIWRNRPHYLKRGSIMVKDLKDGGLKVIDFDKTNWVKSWLKHSDSFWCCLPGDFLNKLVLTQLFCGFILYPNMSLFYDDWFGRNIWSLVDLIDSEGNLLNYDHFCSKHDFNPLKSDFVNLNICTATGVCLCIENILAQL